MQAKLDRPHPSKAQFFFRLSKRDGAQQALVRAVLWGHTPKFLCATSFRFMFSSMSDFQPGVAPRTLLALAILKDDTDRRAPCGTYGETKINVNSAPRTCFPSMSPAWQIIYSPPCPVEKEKGGKKRKALVRRISLSL
jgi:hypothetical protein